jgi:nucleotide-binding universal stress UspA family protein
MVEQSYVDEKAQCQQVQGRWHMFKRILVCLDGSDLAEHVLPHVAEMAMQGPTNIVLLEVLPEHVEVTTGVTQRTPSSVQHHSEEYLQGLASPLAAAGVDVTSVALIGRPEEAIIKYARDNQIDLIAMATHGRGGLQNTLFGSVAQHVLRESGLPILLIRPSIASLRRVQRAQSQPEPAVQR